MYALCLLAGDRRRQVGRLALHSNTRDGGISGWAEHGPPEDKKWGLPTGGNDSVRGTNDYLTIQT